MLGKNLRAVLAGAAAVAVMVGVTGAADAATVAYWQFDEDSTHAVDAVGTNQQLNRQGGTRSATVAADPVPNPDAGPFTTGTPSANPYSVLNPRLLTETSTPFRMTGTSFTMEGWFQSSSATAQFIVGDRMPGSTSGANTAFTGWHVLLAANGTLQFYASTTGGTNAQVNTSSLTPLNDNAFHHFAAVWNAPGNTMSLYIDGLLKGSTTGLGTSGITYAAGANQFAVGGRHTGSNTTVLDNSLFNGRLDEFRFSSAVLSPEEFLNANLVPEPAVAALLPLIGAALLRRR
jgi:hypothetical protein